MYLFLFEKKIFENLKWVEAVCVASDERWGVDDVLGAVEESCKIFDISRALRMLLNCLLVHIQTVWMNRPKRTAIIKQTIGAVNSLSMSFFILFIVLVAFDFGGNRH